MEENSNSDSILEDWDLVPTEHPTFDANDETVHVEEPPNTNTSDNDTSETETAPTDPILCYPT